MCGLVPLGFLLLNIPGTVCVTRVIVLPGSIMVGDKVPWEHIVWEEHMAESKVSGKHGKKHLAVWEKPGSCIQAWRSDEIQSPLGPECHSLAGGVCQV